MLPANVELFVVVKTAPARPVTVPPMPGSGLTLVRLLTVWFFAPISRVAPPLSVRNISVGLARVAMTGMVLSEPEFRRSVPPLIVTTPLRPVMALRFITPPSDLMRPTALPMPR